MTTFGGRVEARFTLPSGLTVNAINGAGTQKAIAVPANDYYLTDLIATLQSQLNTYSDSNAWTASLSTSTGQTTFGCTGTFSLDLLELAPLLGWSNDINLESTPQTGDAQARGLWIPDCPLALDGDPGASPIMSDLRATISPTGQGFAMIGNRRAMYKNVRWTAVPTSRVWTDYEQLDGASWQSFVTETQHGLGTLSSSAFFSPLSPVRIYDLRGNLVGGGSPDGWSISGAENISPTMTKPPYTGLWNISLPSIVGVLET